MFRPISKRTLRRRAQKGFLEDLRQIAENMGEIYPPDSSPSDGSRRRQKRQRGQRTTHQRHSSRKAYHQWYMQCHTQKMRYLQDLKVEVVALRRLLEEHLGSCATHTPQPSSTGYILKPMLTLDEVDALTEDVTEKSFRENLVTYLASLDGDSVSSFADRIFSALFADEVTYHLTFYGRHQDKKTFFASPLYAVILEVFNMWNNPQKADKLQLEGAFKNAFKKAYDRLHKRGLKAALGRSLDEGSPNELVDELPGPSKQY